LAKIPLHTIYWKGKEWTFDVCSLPEHHNDVKVLAAVILIFQCWDSMTGEAKIGILTQQNC
jgi:hypothetical protein